MRPLVWLINSLPIHTRAFIKERIVSLHALDYARYRLNIHVDSGAELQDRLEPCAKEPETVDWLEANLRPGDVFLDIGANVGCYSLIAAAIGGEAVRIYAVEPSPATFAQLARNVLLNRMSGRIFPFCTALSNQNQLMFLQYSNPVTGAANHGWANLGGQLPTGPHTSVPNFRLDDFLSSFGLDSPDLIKLDVDGYERLVLEGAPRTLFSSKLRSVLLEIDRTHAGQAADIKQMLTNAGFALTFSRPIETVLKCVFVRPG